MSSIKAILFDKDGVFVDFEKTWTPVLKVIAADLGGREGAVLTNRLLDVAGFDASSDRFLPGSVWAAGHADDLVTAWAPLLGGMDQRALYAVVERHCVEAMPQPLLPAAVQHQIFSDLKAMGLKLGVATNDMAASARATVERFGLADVFDLVLGFDSVANPKPAGDPVVAFAGHSNVLPHEVMMVGDNTHDMHCGRAGGAGVVVGVLSGNSSRHQLEPLADHIIDDISHLPQLASRLLVNRAKVDG